MKKFVSSVSLFVAMFACTTSTGDFDGISFQPTSMVFAVSERHDLVESNGVTRATRRPDAAMRLVLVFSNVHASPDAEWRRLPSSELLDLRKALATKDGLLISDLPLEDVVAGATLVSTIGIDDDDDAFSAAVVVDADTVLRTTGQSFGSDVKLTLKIDDVSPLPGGFVAGSLEIIRSRGEGQNEEVATGDVTLTFRAPVVVERRGRENLATAIPIMECASARGPVGGAACIDVAPLETFDASGLHRGQ